MQNRAQMKELNCSKDIPKCANEKRRTKVWDPAEIDLATPGSAVSDTHL